MTYPATDLPNLPGGTDLRVGEDPVERDLQLAYWQVTAALGSIQSIINGSLYPKKIVDGALTGSFDTEAAAVSAALVTAVAEYKDIFELTPITVADVTVPV